MSDDDPPIDSAVARQVADALSATSTTARTIVDDHIEQFDEVLSTVLLDEVGEWYRTSVHHGAEGAADAARAVGALADLFTAGGDSMRTVIATGFLEALPRREDPEREVVDQLPEPLRDELRRMENWQPPAP
ncbi:hypothetical protein [Actinomycetospora chiangmaiensis]|uniref:hypothetical protein n=1 Tax=Actinomycetospora chiangmaiensis TaxID=402650 RepID=UPI00037DF46F|nr:hypothetical protein [Actinomycetospora chiangmaiensis]